MPTIDVFTFTSITISLFMILNAYGQIPVFLALLAPYDTKRQQKIMIREMLIALAVLFLFIFFGSKMLQIIGVTKSTLGIGGGVLLFIISLSLLFPKDSSTKGMPVHEPMVVPLAIPGIAGPGTMTAIMVFTAEYGLVSTSAALMLAWIPSLIILLCSSYIKNYLGEKGLQAIERLGGMIIALIGVQMIATGIIDMVKESFNIIVK